MTSRWMRNSGERIATGRITTGLQLMPHQRPEALQKKAVPSVIKEYSSQDFDKMASNAFVKGDDDTGSSKHGYNIQFSVFELDTGHCIAKTRISVAIGTPLHFLKCLTYRCFKVYFITRGMVHQIFRLPTAKTMQKTR